MMESESGVQVTTARLIIRQFVLDDANTLVRFLNDPDFIRYVKDRGVRTAADAQRYLLAGPLKSYKQFGFGMSCVQLRSNGEPIGMCGLLKREELPEVDIGYMFLPEFRHQGYAIEAAAGMVEQARKRFKLKQLLAIVNPDNDRSIGLLVKLGYQYQQHQELFEGEKPVAVYALAL